MIYNRTNFDVTESKRIRNEIIKNGISPSASEIETLERGTVGIETLNRIENKQTELKEKCNKLGYWNVNITNKTWDYTDVFDTTEFDRLINNVAMLRSGFLVFLATPKTPDALYHYQNFNDMEKILFDLDEMSKEITLLFKECGNFYCGEE